MNIKVWIKAFRLRTLPLALASIGMGSFLAASEGNFRLNVLMWAALTTVFLQILSNLANDYGDTKHGADSITRQGPLRTVQSGEIGVYQMKVAIVLMAALSLLSGITLLVVSVGYGTFSFYLFLGMGLLSIVAAYAYTASDNPYGYIGLGDISVLLFFGLLGVLGTCYLHTGSFSAINVLPAVSMGFFATAVLNVNNIRDIDSDREAGKRSIPVRIGRQKAVLYHILLLALGMLAAFLFVASLSFKLNRLIVLIAIIPLVINARAVMQKKDPKSLDPFLRQMAVSSLLFMILFGISIL